LRVRKAHAPLVPMTLLAGRVEALISEALISSRRAL
jgi:hypothetical protein